MNYAASDEPANEVINTRIYELGNSLGFITGKTFSYNNINMTQPPQNTEPGYALLDCINNPGRYLGPGVGH